MQVVIVGAGVAGLTLASKLLENGISTVLIERENAVGGLARSFTYPNGSIFDIGPHRFHTDNDEVQHFITNTLKDDCIWIRRNSQLYLFGKYLPWPVTLKNIFSLPPKMISMVAFDLVFSKKAKTESFEDYIIEKYGKTLFKAFFQPYTEKFVNYTCSNIHKDWATTSINRATIDKKVDTSSLFSLIKTVLFSKDSDTTFIYPRSGGIGVFCDKLASKIQGQGGRILLSTLVNRFVRGEKNRVTTVVTNNNEEISADHVFWSGSLESLRDVGEAPANLPKVHYLSSVFFNYLTSHQIDREFQWCYFGSKEMEVDRIAVPRNFNPICIPKGREGLCVEIGCTTDSKTWADPTRLDCVVETFLLRARLLKDLDCIEGYSVEKVKETYPMYTLNYQRKLKTIFAWVKETLPNLTLFGRTGRFWYNNMDHSIAASLKIARRFVQDSQKGLLRDGDAYSVEDRYFEE